MALMIPRAQVLRKAAFVLVYGMIVAYAVMTYDVRAQLIRGYSDFISGYTAGRILQRGAADRLYDLPLQYEIQRDAAPRVETRQGALPYVRPPFEAWLYRPLAAFSYPTAFAIWNVISVAALIAALALLRAQVVPMQKVSLAVVTVAALSFYPVFQSLLQGQDSTLLLLIYTGAYAALRRERDVAAGLVLAIGTLKFPLVLPFAFVVALHRRMRFTSGFAIGSGLLAALSLAMVGWTGLRQYVIYLAHIDRLAPGVNIPRDMPNLRGLLALVSGPAAHSAAGSALLAIVSVATLAVAATSWMSAKVRSDLVLPLGFSLNVVATILVGFHAHVFDLTLLILPIALMIGVLVSTDLILPATRHLLFWSTALVAFSPLYLLLSTDFRATGLISVVLALFGLALLRAISGLRQQTAAPGSGSTKTAA